MYAHNLVPNPSFGTALDRPPEVMERCTSLQCPLPCPALYSTLTDPPDPTGSLPRPVGDERSDVLSKERDQALRRRERKDELRPDDEHLSPSSAHDLLRDERRGVTDLWRQALEERERAFVLHQVLDHDQPARLGLKVLVLDPRLPTRPINPQSFPLQGGGGRTLMTSSGWEIAIDETDPAMDATKFWVQVACE